ncbi:FAD-NAD(P)-binding [Flaviramulus basaltis]|uniref:FAD-NAD(P)-binding n=1 Tax=Flaviramulus basaltis TaxID=369401 RepID=A0A1K2IA64_9FLAO|nr:FAD/NAD(P)-binding protein [Flaviramulus basaltis]SFZ89287.1 FAD-NAD(P)-binding [Flaviramulus basaltis]
MLNLSNIAIVGSGPTAIYLLNNIWKHIDILKDDIKSITIFEKEKISGMGMPYHPNTTDIYNLANISSEEIPKLPQTLGDWLRQQERKSLHHFNIKDMPIDDTKVYSRVAMGHYFHEQFKQLITSLTFKGIKVVERCESEVIDITKSKEDEIEIKDVHGKLYTFSTVIIANGHVWKEKDKPESGYFASPWPIHKLLPKKDTYYNFPIGTLGASLSAFDVITSLSHRHGKFIMIRDELKYIKHKEASRFKIVLHSAEGWLPHLQYEQQEPMREIYRHFSREQLIELLNEDGFLRIEEFFNVLCRPALVVALTKDNKLDVVEKLKDENFSFNDFVNLMSEKHEYINSFDGMRYEMIAAKDSVYNNIPIHWMETLDDLMYSLNYHAELLPAEDHHFFHKEIMAFLMNVIAALPLQSANILLALYDADCIELKTGMVTVEDNSFNTGKTRITLELENGSYETLEYNLFINCAGQKKIEIEEYPFPSLVKEGTVRSASAKFINSENAEILIEKGMKDTIIFDSDCAWLKLPGIDIDSAYRTINKNGTSNNILFDINFSHTLSLRPYSYGLQACNATSLILIESWITEFEQGKNIGKEIKKITEMYEDNDEL